MRRLEKICEEIIKQIDFCRAKNDSNDLIRLMSLFEDAMVEFKISNREKDIRIQAARDLLELYA